MSENHLMIATPMYGGVCTLTYCVSLALTVADAARKRRNIAFKPGGDSLVTRARNLLTNEFLKSPCTHLMWIDADIGWEPEAIWRMMDSGKDIVVGVYPKKCLPISWPMNFLRQEQNEPLPTCPDTNFIRVKDAPTGFMLIRREVIERLIGRHPEWSCKFSGGDNPVWGNALWEAFIDADQMYLSEDFGFCRRAQAEGFEVWIDPTCTLSHTGAATYGPARMSDAMQMVDLEDNGIEGWCSPVELGWLKATAATMESVVEVGCWKGRSTVALASGCKGVVYAVDHWQGSKDERDGPHKEATEKDIRAIFEDNIKAAEEKGLIARGSVVIMPYESTEAAMRFKLLNNEVIDVTTHSCQFRKTINVFNCADMVYIDAGHTYEEVKADIEVWRPIARKLICGHDYNHPEVAKAVNDVFGPHVVNPVGSIWAYRVTSENHYAVSDAADVVDDELDFDVLYNCDD